MCIIFCFYLFPAEVIFRSGVYGACHHGLRCSDELMLEQQLWRQTCPERPSKRMVISPRPTYFSCFGILVVTSWFKINDGSSLPHECRLHHLFECYIPGIWYRTDPHEQQKRATWLHFFVEDLGLALVAKTCPHQPQAFKKAKKGQEFL